jgi:hypothetical protein
MVRDDDEKQTKEHPALLLYTTNVSPRQGADDDVKRLDLLVAASVLGAGRCWSATVARLRQRSECSCTKCKESGPVQQAALGEDGKSMNVEVG